MASETINSTSTSSKEDYCLAMFSYDLEKYGYIDDTESVKDILDNGGDATRYKDYFQEYGVYDKANQWKVIDVRDHDNIGESGFFGAAVQTDPNHITISFSGSNDNFDKLKTGNINDMKDFYEEWVVNNMGLFNSTEPTPQQNDAAEYVVQMMKANPNARFSITGHSLGGQLSFYAAIYIAENCDDAMLDRLDGVLNIDGPGFSKAFLEEHADAIQKLVDRGLLEHWQYSMVGNLLNQPEGVKNTVVELQEDDIEGWKRHTSKIKFDGDEPSKGEIDTIAQYLGDYSKKLDGAAYNLDNNPILQHLPKGAKWLLGFSIFTLITGEVGLEYLASHPGDALKVSGAVLAALALKKLAVFLGPHIIAFLAVHPVLLCIIATIAAVVLIAVIAGPLVEFITSVFEKWFQKQLDGDYGIKYDGVKSAIQIFEKLGGELIALSEEIGALVGSIRYGYDSGFFAKNKISTCAGHFEELGKKADVVKDALQNSIGNYKYKDNEARDKYIFC